MSEMMKKPPVTVWRRDRSLGKENHDILVVDVDIGKSVRPARSAKSCLSST